MRATVDERRRVASRHGISDSDWNIYIIAQFLSIWGDIAQTIKNITKLHKNGQNSLAASTFSPL